MLNTLAVFQHSAFSIDQDSSLSIEHSALSAAVSENTGRISVHHSAGGAPGGGCWSDRISASHSMTRGCEEACAAKQRRSEEHTSELQSHHDLVCRLLL